jgi:hypothetical protein
MLLVTQTDNSLKGTAPEEPAMRRNKLSRKTMPKMNLELHLSGC